MKTLVKVTEHTDIKGKKQKYLLIGEPPEQVIINIGDKTFNAITELEKLQYPITNTHNTDKLNEHLQNDIKKKNETLKPNVK